MTEEEADALKRDIAGLGVPLALIVGDTASSFFPGDDENSNVEAGTYARTLRSFAECAGTPAMVALCHPTKGASRSNLLPRGGGAFLNELDGNLPLVPRPGEVTELHWCGKIRGPDFSAFGYRLRQVPTGLIDEKSREEMTIVAEPMTEEAVADHAKQTLANEDVVLRALRDHPDWSWAQIARETGWVDDDDRPERWKVHGTANARRRQTHRTAKKGRFLATHREGRKSAQQGQPVVGSLPQARNLVPSSGGGRTARSRVPSWRARRDNPQGQPLVEIEQIVAEAFTEAGHRCRFGLKRCFSWLLQSCFRTAVSRRDPRFSAEAALLQEGGLPLLLKR